MSNAAVITLNGDFSSKRHKCVTCAKSEQGNELNYHSQFISDENTTIRTDH